MRKRQCRKCGKNPQSDDTGKVVKTDTGMAKLPGHKGPPFLLRFYFVQCSKCEHEWRYRKKIG